VLLGLTFSFFPSSITVGENRAWSWVIFDPHVQTTKQISMCKRTVKYAHLFETIFMIETPVELHTLSHSTYRDFCYVSVLKFCLLANACIHHPRWLLPSAVSHSVGLLSSAHAHIILDDSRETRYHTVGGYYRVLSENRPTDELFGGTNIDDLERPWTPNIWVLSEFFAILGCGAHLEWMPFPERYGSMGVMKIGHGVLRPQSHPL